MSPVLITVFDGLQPAQVTPALMPNLARFASEGVTFANHHPVYPSVTRINAASMVTGRYPGAHGLAANTLVVREMDPYVAFSALEPTLTRLKERTGRVLLAPTLADLLARHGMEYVAIGTGTTGNAFVHNPDADESGGATIHPEFTLPRGLYGELEARFGEWPPEAMPAVDRLARAVDVMTGYILPERRPAVAFIWFSEPDHAQHAHGVGSVESVRAVGAADEQFGRLLAWLETSGRAADFDVMVTSDHGYSTIKGVVDIEAELSAAGFPAANMPGGVAVAPNGASALFYVHDRDPDTADALAAWLMAQPWCGPVLASGHGVRRFRHTAGGAAGQRRRACAGTRGVARMGRRVERGRVRRNGVLDGRRAGSGATRLDKPHRNAQRAVREGSQFRFRPASGLAVGQRRRGAHRAAPASTVPRRPHGRAAADRGARRRRPGIVVNRGARGRAGCRRRRVPPARHAVQGRRLRVRRRGDRLA